MRWLAAAAATSALVAGCGGEAGEGLTKAEFVERGDAICSRAETRKNERLTTALNRLAEAGEQLTPAREEELVRSVALPPIEQMVEELSELPPPAGDEERVASMLTAYEEAIVEVAADPAAAIGGSQPFSEAGEMAADYGFEACAEV
jgi:hypothetical protein